MKPNLHIFIVTYKRPAVFQRTMEHLFRYSEASNFFGRVTISVGVNETNDDYKMVEESIGDWYLSSQSLQEVFHTLEFVHFGENKGKAFVLNYFTKNTATPDSFIITMDDDMVFTNSYMEVFDLVAEKLRFELIGFASKQFWGHYPEKPHTMYLDWHNGYKVWHTMSIAGGIMMGRYDFLSQYEWTNVDGIYGGDDFNMCYNTDAKFIVEDDREWLVHDPYGPSLPELKRYYDAKQFYREQGLFVYPHGWYEDADV